MNWSMFNEEGAWLFPFDRGRDGTAISTGDAAASSD